LYFQHLMKLPEGTVYFAPVVIPLICEDHHADRPLSMAYSLPVGVRGTFYPLGEKRMELWAAGWDKPVRISLPVEERKWEPGLNGLDRLLHYCYTYNIDMPGFRLELETTDTSVDAFSLLVPLVLNYLSEEVKELPTPVKAKWISRIMPGIQCDAQAYGWADLTPDHIFLFDRGDDVCLIAPDPLSGWQKLLIRVPAAFNMMMQKNSMSFTECADIIQNDDRPAYFLFLRHLGLYTGNAKVQHLLSRFNGHEAQGISLPLTEGQHHYLLVYVHPRAVQAFIDFCERSCQMVFQRGYTIHLVEENFPAS